MFKLSLLAVRILVPLAALRPIPLTWLGPDTRTRALNRIDRSALCGPAIAVKAILCILYYEHPEAAAEINFDGQCLKDADELPK